MAKRKRPTKDLTFEVLRVALIEKVRALGASQIVCQYSGSGDSGQIDDVSLDQGDLENGERATWFVDKGMAFDKAQGKFVPIMDETQEMSLKDAVHAYCYAVIEKNHPGDWVNNEGGGGELTITLTIPPKVQLKCYDNLRVTHNWMVDCESGAVKDLGVSFE